MRAEGGELRRRVPRAATKVKSLVGAVRAVRSALASAEKQSGRRRRDALTRLATQLDGDASSAADQAKVKQLAGEVRELAGR